MFDAIIINWPITTVINLFLLGLMIRFRAFSALLSYSTNEATSTFCSHVLCSFNYWLSNEQTFSQNCKRFRKLLASVLRRDESEAVHQFSIYPKAVTSSTTNISGWDIFWKLKTTLSSATEDVFLMLKKTEQFSFSRTLWAY